MKLNLIMEREGQKYERMLVPTNSGLDQAEIDPYRSLGIEKRKEAKYTDKNTGIEIWRARGEDIPEMLDFYTNDKQIPVIGFTGDDLLDEYKLRTPTSQIRSLDTIDWNIPGMGSQYSRPSLCLISEAKPTKKMTEDSIIVVNKKYKATAQMYLAEITEELGIGMPNIRYIGGQLENEIPENADYGIEIVVSGCSLRNLDKTSRSNPRLPELTVARLLRQSDITVATSWQPEKEPIVYAGSIDALAQQYATIQNRLTNPTDSTTSKLLRNPNELIKKIGEEAMELGAAVTKDDPKNVLEESENLLWTIQMALAQSGQSWDDFTQYVAKKQ